MKLLLAEAKGFSPRALALLRRKIEVIEADLDRAQLVASLYDTEALWVRLRTRIDREVFEAAPKLRYLLTATTGLNHVDFDEAQRRSVQVLSLRGEEDFLRDIRATAELTVGLALALLRRIPTAFAHVKEGGWNRDLFIGQELYRKTAGVIGYGRLGRIVARYLRAFDMNVLACDPRVPANAYDPGVEPVPLVELLKRADVVTLHASWSKDSDRFFDANAFAAMKTGAVFVNTARGELIDEAALLTSLANGRLAGAALDVLQDEQGLDRSSHPLLVYARAHDNLLLTPHIGGRTHESTELTELFLADKFLRHLEAEHE